MNKTQETKKMTASLSIFFLLSFDSEECMFCEISFLRQRLVSVPLVSLKRSEGNRQKVGQHNTFPHDFSRKKKKRRKTRVRIPSLKNIDPGSESPKSRLLCHKICKTLFRRISINLVGCQHTFGFRKKNVTKETRLTTIVDKTVNSFQTNREVVKVYKNRNNGVSIFSVV